MPHLAGVDGPKAGLSKSCLGREACAQQYCRRQRHVQPLSMRHGWIICARGMIGGQIRIIQLIRRSTRQASGDAAFEAAFEAGESTAAPRADQHLIEAKRSTSRKRQKPVNAFEASSWQYLSVAAHLGSDAALGRLV